MSVEKPNLWRVLSDTWRIISSNSLHFLALSLLFVFPLSLLNIIHTLTDHLQPSSSHSHSHYRRLLSTFWNQENSDSGIPPLEKSQILFQYFLYGLISLVFNLCSVSSITHSIFHGFNRKPIKLASSLKSILSSFFPLLATRMAYLMIMAVISLGFGFWVAFVFLGLSFMGFEIDATSKSFMAVVLVVTIPLLVMLVYLVVRWFLTDAIVVLENKYGFAPFQRSMNLMEAQGARGLGLLMMLLFSVLQMILYSALGRRSVDGGCSGGVAVQMVAYACFSTLLSLFTLGAKTVLFVYCKAFNGESELPSTDDKLGQVYVQLPRHVVHEV